jgi:hypothetical protein
VDGDMLSKDGDVEDLVSRKVFGDFEIEFEWKLAPGGNAGFFYRGTREYDHIYWSAPEYQLLDDALHPDGRDRLTAAASAYALYAAPAGVVKSGGEWNAARVVVDGARVEHWLNGQKVVTYELWSPDWKRRSQPASLRPIRITDSRRRVLIGIQGDHDGNLALRHMRIRKLR